MKRFLNTYKKYISAGLTLMLLVSLIGATKSSANRQTPNIKAALLYCDNIKSKNYLDTYSQLQHSFMANFEIEKVDAGKQFLNLNKYDLIYLDSSISSMPELKDKIVNYVEKGNNVFVPNCFAAYFDLNFFGAKEVVKIESVPTGLVYADISNDISGIQEIIKDFSKVYEKYEDYDYLSQLDYGYGFIPDSAVSIADFNGVSLYGINNYGKGTVFYTNPLLPNSFHINGFSLEKTNELQTHFINSTATANQLILSEYASYISKIKYGYSIKKVLGSFGTPTMAWQLHYEEISALQNCSAIKFGEMCKEYNTIPSFTLIRNTYKWFSKYESITYLLGDNSLYHMNLNENAYSSGAHIVEGDDYLALNEAENTGSYFDDNYNFMQMAYPYVDDLNKDGLADIICGSSDGKFYYFEGKSSEDGWKVRERYVLTDLNGNELRTESYSSPSLYDYDHDGILDIISGDEKGNIILFKGVDNIHFQKGIILMSVPEIQRSMPFAYDLNKDNIMDIVVGSLNGVVNIYEGVGDGGFKHINTIECQNETFMAPFLYDYNKDNFVDLICGTFDGYVRKFKNNGEYNFIEDGYYDTEEMNYKGNNHIKFGNNCVPRFFDINGDNQDDLIAGELEYGLAIPIDSPYFKYRNELQAQIDYMKNNNYYLGVHFYTSEYSSPEREAEELRLHKRAFDTYAIDYDDVGANLHTWRMSEFSPYQTLILAKDAGLKWISCFRAVSSNATPDASAEFSLISPFFTDFEKKDFMVTNASVLGYTYDSFAYMSAKYDLPISEYYHCDFVYRDEQVGRNMVEKLVSYQKANNYNFVREDQLIKSAAAAYNMELKIDSDRSDTLSISSGSQNKDFKLYDKDYQSSTGVKIEFSDTTDISDIGLDAQVWRYDKNRNSLYIGLNSKVSLDFNCIQNTKKYKLITSDVEHILSVNIPAYIKINDNKATVKFEDDGMMQISVLGEIRNCSDGWNAEFDGGITTITKFGSEADLTFEFAD